MPKDYYKGAYRITIQGVPVRVTVKPTPHMLAECREAVDWSQPGYVHGVSRALEAAGFSL